MIPYNELCLKKIHIDSVMGGCWVKNYVVCVCVCGQKQYVQQEEGGGAGKLVMSAEEMGALPFPLPPPSSYHRGRARAKEGISSINCVSGHGGREKGKQVRKEKTEVKEKKDFSVIDTARGTNATEREESKRSESAPTKLQSSWSVDREPIPGINWTHHKES